MQCHMSSHHTKTSYNNYNSYNNFTTVISIIFIKIYSHIITKITKIIDLPLMQRKKKNANETNTRQRF